MKESFSKKAVGERLKGFRLSMHMTQKEFAEEIDITPDESIRRNTDTKFNIKASAEHLAKVRNAYLSIINENNLLHVNGMQPIEYIFDEVISNIEEYRKRYGKRI